jgi:hypothetical protein
MLQESGYAVNPFGGEGLDFWGDVPPFSPREFPTGHIYENHRGEAGHEASAEDASEEVIETLRRRLGEVSGQAPILVNKNPYNTVRLPWLRAVLPDSRIVAVVRRPIPNVYSLLKKYQPHDERGEAPHDGWWGVKPRSWKELRNDDKIIQCSRQWCAVNERVLRDRKYLDMVVRYDYLCARPAETIKQIIGIPDADIRLGPIRCLDNEYATGSRLRSKNRYYRETGTLDVPADEAIEFPALDDRAITRIQDICAPVESQLPLDG